MNSLSVPYRALLCILGLGISFCVAQEAITPGVDIRWNLKESVSIPQELCFTCPGLVTLGNIFASYCSNCFGVWIPTGETDYCLHYKGPLQLDYDKVREYRMSVLCKNGVNTDTTTVVLKVIPNSKPYFTKSTSISVVNGGATNLATLEAGDFDTEDVLTWTIQPHTYKSKFNIRKTSNTNAVLERKTDLSEVCVEEITLHLIISDGFNPPVGTTTVTIELDNNTPQVTSLNKEVQWAENRPYYTYFKGPNVGGATGSCTVTTDPPGYGSQIFLGGCKSTVYPNPYFIQTGSAGFDFETTPPINFTLNYQKGKCPSKPAWIRVTWKDINEKPILTLNKETYTVEEGSIDVTPEYDANDPDDGDKITFKLSNPNTAAPFEIDQNTGRLYTNRYFSAGGAASVTREIDVYIIDKAGLKSDVNKVTLTINDVNDNAPKLDAFTTTYYFEDCQDLGTIATITAQDADPGVNGEVEFVEETSGTMTLTKTGELLLSKAPFDKEFDTINIRAVDKGSPLKYSEIKQVSVIGSACPTTPGPTTYPPTTQPPPPPTTTTPMPTTPPPTDPPTTPAPPPEPSFYDDPWNIALLALAGVVGFIAMVAALCFIIRCSRICCNKPSPKSNVIQPQKPVGQKANPMNARSSPPNSKTGSAGQNNDPGKTMKPDGDAESGVFEAEEEVFEEGGANHPGSRSPVNNVPSPRQEPPSPVDF